MLCKYLKKLFGLKTIKNVIIIGHNNKRRGAKVISYESEYKYNSKVGHIVKSLLPEIEVCFYNELEPDYVVISDPGFIAIELHCNAYNGYVSGSECLVLKGDPKSKEYAVDLLNDLCERFQKKNRGVKELGKGDRGYSNLKKAKSKGARVALIIEPFFGDNEKDIIHTAEYAQFLVDWFNN